MGEITIYTVPGSPFGRSVMMALEEKGQPWRLLPLHPSKIKSAEHFARHPFGKMPAIEHDGFHLYECQAILRYIDRIFPEPALTPCDSKLAARMDQVMNINDWYLFQNCAAVIAFQRVVGPKLMGLTPDEAAIAQAMPRAETAMAELSRLLGDQKYFAGDAMSLADIVLSVQLDFMAMTPEWSTLTNQRNNVTAWLERIRQRPSFKATSWENVAQMAAA